MWQDEAKRLLASTMGAVYDLDAADGETPHRVLLARAAFALMDGAPLLDRTRVQGAWGRL